MRKYATKIDIARAIGRDRHTVARHVESKELDLYDLVSIAEYIVRHKGRGKRRTETGQDNG